jgi:hypothetical protein
MTDINSSTVKYEYDEEDKDYSTMSIEDQANVSARACVVVWDKSDPHRLVDSLTFLMIQATELANKAARQRVQQ